MGRKLEDAAVQLALNELGDVELEESADGSRVIDSPENGIELYFSREDFLSRIVLHESDHDDELLVRYAGELPFSLNWSMTRENVRSIHGQPKAFAEAKTDLGLRLDAWDEFQFEKVCLWISYSEGSCSIRTISTECLGFKCR